MIEALQQKVDTLKAAAAGKPRTSPEFLAAVEAVKELASAKKAAVVVEDQADLLARAKAAQAERAGAAAAKTAVVAAIRMMEKAEQWPRCGQGWPATSAEKAAQKTISANPVLVNEFHKYGVL